MRVVASITGVASALILLTGIVHAQDCAYQDGGYCLSTITATTSGYITEKERIGADKIFTGIQQAPSSGNTLIDGISYLEFYKSLWDEMIKSGKATEEKKEEVFKLAEESGGSKIGGVNLVVLAAGTLQHMVDKGVITRQEAQKVLNDSKVKR